MNIVHLLLALSLVLLGLDVALEVDGDVLVWLGILSAVGAALYDASRKNNRASL